MIVKVKKLNKDAKLPIKGSVGSACYDVFSIKMFMLSPMEKAKLPTGLAFELPEGWGLEVRPRSGLATRGLMILNSPGTIDSDYRGELFISCINMSHSNIRIGQGDRIAQIRLFEVLNLNFEEVEELSETERGEGGFGSTGL